MKIYRLIPAIITAASLLGAIPVYAAELNTNKTMSYSGKVTTTSPTAETITVLHNGWTETFRIGRDTKLSTPEKSEASLKDFAFGDKVNVQYQDNANGVTAINIREKASK
jgi:hypothetical protein